MPLKIRGYWEIELGLLNITIVLAKNDDDVYITFSNQTELIGGISIPAHNKKVTYKLAIRENILSNYIVVSLDDQGYLLKKVTTKIKLTADISQQIGKAFVSFSSSVIDQIDGLLASL